MTSEDQLFDALKYRIEKAWDGTIRYYNLDNSIHREGGPAIIHPNGDQYWAQHGRCHRLDGPAVIADGNEEWWVNGKPHRLDGPAAKWANGDCQWWINGTELTKAQFNEFTKSITV